MTMATRQQFEYRMLSNCASVDHSFPHAFSKTTCFAVVVLLTAAASVASEVAPTDQLSRGLIGHWKLQGDCRDYSASENHGVNHGVQLSDGKFDGRRAYVEVPASPSLRLGTGDFTLTARIHVEKEINDIVGDVFEMYDPETRRGITLSIKSSAGGYQSQGTDRNVFFGIDNAKLSEWEDCGRPNPTSNYVSNSLTVFRGKLYAATVDAKDEADRRHVYCYEGGQRWTDCGQVGTGRWPGVGPLIVHAGHLFAATSTYDWTRVRSVDYAPGRVFRYDGGTTWTDCGEPSENRTLNSLASYRGELFVGSGPQRWGVFTNKGDGNKWQASKLFPMSGIKKCFPHAMCCFNDKLYVGFPSVYSFDGKNWTYEGVPVEPENKLQTHSLTAYQGQLCAGTWPLAKVARLVGAEGEKKWEAFGRVGEDGTEVNSLVVYNGKLYGGSIPRAEVCRYDGGDQWTSLKRFYSPPGWTPAPPVENGGNPTTEELNAWSRVTSMTIHKGRLFASIGSCTSSVLDAPADVRGSVHSMEAGKCISDDNDLGAGWKHLVAMRQAGKLKLYVDGKLVAESAAFDQSEYDLSTDRPLRIGFGQTDYFHGKINDVRLYNRALDDATIAQLAAERP